MKEHEETTKQKKSRKSVTVRTCLLGCLLSLMIGMVLTLGILFARLDRDGQSMLQAVSTIRSQFVGEYDWHSVMDESLEQMVTSLGDRWSYYLTQDEYQKVQASRSNSYIGIGVTISQTQGDAIRIETVKEGSPAARAGIQSADSIRKVEDVAVTQDTWQQCVDMLKGEAGTSVRVEVQSADGVQRGISLTRETIKTISVTHKMLPDQVGLVRIRNFYSGSGDGMIAAVDALVKDGAQSIVFDLRDNPGGYITELTKMLDHLLPEGVIFQSRNLKGQETLYRSDAEMVDLPMAVLVNADSYSAAEFFAAELREAKGSFIAGELTSGKGYAQEIFPLRNGSALGLSVARYFTGDGASLIGVGVEPDAKLSLSDEDRILLIGEKLPEQQDIQLQAAVGALLQGGVKTAS